MKYVALMLFILSSSARAEFYIEGGALALQKLRKFDSYSLDVELSSHEVRTFTFPNYRQYDINEYCNPYASIAAGYDKSFGKFTLDLQARHQSSLCAHDRGQNSIGLLVRWYPFR